MQPLRVLVVSHSAEYRDSIKASFMKKDGSQCQTAATPQEAERLIGITSMPFDILIIDHQSFSIDAGLTFGLPALLGARYASAAGSNARVNATGKTVVVVCVNDRRDGEVMQLYPNAEITEAQDAESIIFIWEDYIALRERSRELYQLAGCITRHSFAKMYGGKWIVYEGQKTLNGLQAFDSRVELFLALGNQMFSRKRPTVAFITQEGLFG